ncbi:uncharacterized protein LOC134852132 [Symsagittifera roscoffensis]|uniref:uncharacterized protein LOC134852132 n=1 Tax=Symsagittifera roscoffensis TaxID=84072 RepID=UPI00307BF399
MVYGLTLKVFNEVNKPVPEYNFQPYMDQAAQLNMTLLELEIGLDAENETNSDLAISSADIRAEIDSLIQTSRSLNKDLSIFLVQLYEMESGLNATVNAVTKQYYTGLERLALLKGFQNATGNDSAQSSFDEQYRRIPLIRERMEDATDKCNAASRREDQFDGQVDTVNQNAQLVLDGVVRKRDAVEDVWSKLDGMTGLILSERGQVRLMQDKIAQLDRSCDDTLPLTGAKQAQQKASDDAAEAEKKSKELRGTLADTKATVDQLKNILEDTPFLTKQEKDDFEDVLAKLGDLEGDLDIEQMEKVADAMEGKVDDLDQMVKDYETKYLQALEDVQNAEEIAGNVKVICQMITTPVS